MKATTTWNAIRVAIGLFAFATSAYAQTKAGVTWTLNRSSSPYKIQIDLSGTKYDFAQITSAGVPTPYFASTFCSANEWITASSGIPLCAQLAFSNISGTANLATQVSGVLPVANGGANCSAASGTCVDNIGGVSATGIMRRTGAGAYSFGTAVNLGTEIAGTLGIANGGTGQATQQAAINALTGTQSNKKYLRSDGTNAGLSDNLAADVKGTTTNDDATAGYIGEYISSEVLIAGEVTLTTGVAANITSVSLTAGDWDCSGNIVWDTPAATTVSVQLAWISTTSATPPTAPNKGGSVRFALTTGSIAGLKSDQSIGNFRVSIASTTTVYLSAIATFAVSTEKVYGFIGCRRVR